MLRVRTRSEVYFSRSRVRPMSTAGVSIVDPQRAFLEHLPVIDRAIASIARRHALSSSDAEEFASWAKARIVASEYAVFRKFGGRSSMATYLSAVLAHLFLDYRNSFWGRWRPSAAATRLGPVAIRLEELLHRDGHTMREAREVLRSAGVPLSDIEISRLATQLPMRQPSDEVPLEALDGSRHEAGQVPAEPDFDDAGLQVLRDALQALPAEDQVIMRMRFWQDLSVAEIARILHLDQKPLYRRIDAIEQTMRALLTTRGMDRERARDLLSSEVVW
jgi:RNA polymerase sigma factor (sigma-70 family)